MYISLTASNQSWESLRLFHTWSVQRTAFQCLTYAFWYLDLGLGVTALKVTEKLMLILQVSWVDISHPYFLKKILVKKVRPIYEYVR